MTDEEDCNEIVSTVLCVLAGCLIVVGATCATIFWYWR